MTSKSLFFKLIQEDGKRRLWAVTLAFLMFFFSLPFTIAMAIGEFMKRRGNLNYHTLSTKAFIGISEWFYYLFDDCFIHRDGSYKFFPIFTPAKG